MDQLAQRLAHERVRRGLSTFDLAQRTKIREPYIQAIERGTYNVLPAVYVRSFIRTIGAELGVPHSEINRLIHQCLDSDDDATAPSVHRESAHTTSTSTKGSGAERSIDPVASLTSAVNTLQGALRGGVRNWSARTITFAAIGVLAVGLIIWFIVGRANNEGAVGLPPEIVDITSSVEEDSLILTAMATDTAELTITMDGTRYQKFIVLPETEYRWSAMKKFTVSNIFNAGVIQFSRDGKPLPLYGKRGEVLRELVITRTEVIASNTSTKMVTPPADPERARRDSILEQQRRDSIRAERRKENQRIVQERRSKAKAKSRSNVRSKTSNTRTEHRITKTPPRSVR